ncbi:MAG TPA: hypothetical protein VIZ86_16785 [Pseudomonas sp.]
MTGFSYRPLARGAIRLRGVARRLAEKLRGKAGVKTEIHDGYLLRAAGSARSVTVTAIDPEALWLFLHHQGIDGSVGVPGVPLEWSLGTRAYTRDQLNPAPPDPAAPPAAPSTPADSALASWAPGYGYFGTVYAGTGPNINTASIPHARRDRVATTVLLNSADFVIGNTPYAAKFQLYGHAADPMRRKLLLADADTSQMPVRGVDARDWVLSEAGMRSATGDPLFQFFPRSTPSYGHIPVFSAQVAREVLMVFNEAGAQSVWHSDVVVAGAYVTQPSTSAQGRADRRAGLFLTRLRRPLSAQGATYPLEHLWSVLIPATANPLADLQPDYLPPDDPELAHYEPHGVSSVGIAVVPGAEGEGEGAMLVAALYRETETAMHTALQVIVTNADGVGTAYTARTGSDNRQWRVGPECTMFGLPGVLVIEADVEGGMAKPMGLTLLHVGADGVARETGLKAAGWQPYTQQTGQAASPMLVGGWGQAAVWAAHLGNNRVAVIAVDHDRDGAAETIIWSVVALDATTGAFVEVLGALPATGNFFGYSAHLSVITPTTLNADNTVRDEAVLMASLFSKHYLSRDGGRTWAPHFDGFYGFPVYLGNRLHKVEVGANL